MLGDKAGAPVVPVMCFSIMGLQCVVHLCWSCPLLYVSPVPLVHTRGFTMTQSLNEIFLTTELFLLPVSSTSAAINEMMMESWS